MMKPILDDLKANYADTFKTEFIDVWEDGEAGKAYGINLIPTQIFFGADGDEEQNVTFRMASGCQNIRAFAEALTAKGPVDGYAEIGAGSAGVVLSTSRETLKGCCAGCVVPSAVMSQRESSSWSSQVNSSPFSSSRCFSCCWVSR